MKNVLTIIFLTLISTIGYSFDYKSYVKQYIDSVNNTQVRHNCPEHKSDTVCQDLVFDMLEPIKDYMLMDIPKNYGTIVSLEQAQIGDIVTYGNHIAVVYSNESGVIKIADQNRHVRHYSGNELVIDTIEKFVKISEFIRGYSNWKSFIIYRPIELSSIPLYGELNKRQLCDLYSIYVKDEYDMKRTNIKYYTENKNHEHFFDVNCEVSELDWYFALYYNNVLPGKGVYNEDGLLVYTHYLKTPKGFMKVEKCGDFGDFDNHPVRWLSKEEVDSLGLK